MKTTTLLACVRKFVADLQREERREAEEFYCGRKCSHRVRSVREQEYPAFVTRRSVEPLDEGESS